mmetsp:Transcript_29232/g.86481  ORF Transcript_29232/g.86481 Transcript_29232/m.86481 type:complete len:491 (-) Transcript_29232:300-1772(-)
MAGSVPADKSGCSAVGRPASPAMCASASHPPSGDITMACAPGEPSHGINEPGPHGPLPLPLPLPEPSSSPPSASLAVARSAGRPAAPLCSGAPPECCPASIVSMLVPRRPGLSPPRRPAAPGTGVGCDAYAAAMRPSTDANRSLPPSWKMLEGDTGSGWLSNDVRPGLAAAVDAAAARDCAPVGIDRNGGSDGSAAHAAPPTPLPALPRASASAPNACAPPPAPPPVALPVAPGDVADATRSRLEASSPPAHPRAATTSEASVRSMRAGVGAAPAPAPAPSNASIASLVVDLLCSGACVRVARTPAVCGSSREVGANAGVGVAKDGAMACTAADCRGGPGAASDAVPGAAEDAPRASNEPPVPPPPVPPKPLRPMLPAPPEPPAPLSPAPPPPPAPLPSASPKPTSSFCSSSNASDGASRCAGKLCSAPPALVNGRRGSGSGGASAAGRWSARLLSDVASSCASHGPRSTTRLPQLPSPSLPMLPQGGAA